MGGGVSKVYLPSFHSKSLKVYVIKEKHILSICGPIIHKTMSKLSFLLCQFIKTYS